MAKELEVYEIEYDDGTKRYRKLDKEGHERFERAAKNKASTVKSISKGTPEPDNKQRQGARNKQRQGD